MGGHGSGRLNKTDAFLKQNREVFNTVSDQVATMGGQPLIVPNHSGDHSAGIVNETPINDTDIVNKKYVDDMAKNYFSEVRKGNFAGSTMISIQGHDKTVPNGGPFDLSPGFGGLSYVVDQSVIFATPAVVGVSSTDADDTSAGAGAQTVRIFGTDSTGVLAFNDVSMTGLTAAFTADEFKSVHSIITLTSGASNWNEGTLWVGTGTVTSGVPAVRMLSMEIAHNKSFTGYYVVPTGKKLVFNQFITTIAGNKEGIVHIATSLDGIQWAQQGEFAQSLQPDVIAIPALAAGIHVKLTGQATNSNTNITSILAGELYDV